MDCTDLSPKPKKPVVEDRKCIPAPEPAAAGFVPKPGVEYMRRFKRPHSHTVTKPTRPPESWIWKRTFRPRICPPKSDSSDQGQQSGRAAHGKAGLFYISTSTEPGTTSVTSTEGSITEALSTTLETTTLTFTTVEYETTTSIPQEYTASAMHGKSINTSSYIIPPTTTHMQETTEKLSDNVENDTDRNLTYEKAFAAGYANASDQFGTYNNSCFKHCIANGNRSDCFAACLNASCKTNGSFAANLIGSTPNDGNDTNQHLGRGIQGPGPMGTGTGGVQNLNTTTDDPALNSSVERMKAQARLGSIYGQIKKTNRYKNRRERTDPMFGKKNKLSVRNKA